MFIINKIYLQTPYEINEKGSHVHINVIDAKTIGDAWKYYLFHLKSISEKITESKIKYNNGQDFDGNKHFVKYDEVKEDSGEYQLLTREYEDYNDWFNIEFELELEYIIFKPYKYQVEDFESFNEILFGDKKHYKWTYEEFGKYYSTSKEIKCWAQYGEEYTYNYRIMCCDDFINNENEKNFYREGIEYFEVYEIDDTKITRNLSQIDICRNREIRYNYNNVPHKLKTFSGQLWIYKTEPRIWKDGEKFPIVHLFQKFVNVDQSQINIIKPKILIENESASVIQNAWKDAKVNPYCKLGINTINRNYDETLGTL